MVFIAAFVCDGLSASSKGALAGGNQHQHTTLRVCARR
jgi:hypothetical protein